MWLFRRLFAAALLLSACASYAATVGVHTASWHDRPGFRTLTPGAYLRTDAGLTAGALRNSEGRASAYAGWTWGTDEARRLSAAATAGVITGYSLAPAVPFVIPSAAVRITEQLTARALLIPRIAPKGANAVSITLEWRIQP